MKSTFLSEVCFEDGFSAVDVYAYALVHVCGSVCASCAQGPVLISRMWGSHVKIDGKGLVASDA